jgi:hypothetical protein
VAVLDKADKLEGYWFADKSRDAAGLAAGAVIKNADDKPPFMVVYKGIANIIVTASNWGGSLWRARVVKLGDMSGLIPDVWYWRAVEIELIEEELPAGLLFGNRGDEIARLANQIPTLTSEQADKLYALKSEKSRAESAYARAWDCWNEGLAHPRSHDYSGIVTLYSPSRDDTEGSPTNYGFTLIHNLVWKRAGELDGDAAFVEYLEDGETETELNPRWNAVSSAFLYQAMVLSMGHCLSESERAALTRAWSSVFC